ncbi:MAG: DNA recombination protein RmuC [Phycisphaeraceae bacterium]|nr:DNA recombination protein RmuC [Phycisphaeraceae bacterium]MBX3365834.1 DNA recombination protein RmuC [Phycisphaeraceae bacterium]QYK48320.1 MAG: DNA recombination protein RmuC [Phycisphaeraceae bacterium]
MTNVLLVVLAVTQLVTGVLVIVLVRNRRVDLSPVIERLDRTEAATGAASQALRDEISRLRTDGAEQSRQQREEISNSQRGASDSLTRNLRDIGSQQAERLDAFADLIARGNAANQETGRLLREELAQSIRLFTSTASEQSKNWGEAIDRRMEALRASVEQRLKEIQEDNSKKLESIRQTVDEKLHDTLERRLGESFKLVSERLELVHKGLGEMHTLASGVGDLKKVLTNVKARGTWSEQMLGNLLEQMLTPEQYERNIATKPGSAERVEFALRLPGKNTDSDDPVWLPIDAKCPKEDYERIVDASERGDPDAVRESVKQLEIQIKNCARDIAQKYISPPATTDFAILYAPTEGLYAEILRCHGLTEFLQREHRVVVAGPTTLAALLNSLQMGFRTLAIEKRSSEVWKVLSAVKTEFGKFSSIIEKVRKKLSEASNTIDDASVRTRAVQRKLKAVEEMPILESSAVLGIDAAHLDADSEAEPAEE